MEERINIYVDMDGVQAVYGRDNSVEEMAAKGYFLTRPVQENAVGMIRKLKDDPRFNVVVLSAVFQDNHSEMEKSVWLSRCGLGDVEKCFMPCGEPKANYVHTKGINILIDDFSKNLLEWENNGPGFVGIKFINGINGNRGSWLQHGGFTINHNMSAEKLFIAVSGIAEALYKAA